MKKKHVVQSGIIGVCVFALACLFQFTGLFTWSENKAYDGRIKATAPLFTASDDISLVIIDQESLDWAKEELHWSWPWPREAYGKIIDFFNRGNAASVAFDLVFTEPSFYGDADDEKFAESCKEYNRAVHTVFYQNHESDDAVLPIPVIKDSARIIGNVQSLLDKDGTARRERFYSTSSLKEPSLSIASLLISDEIYDSDPNSPIYNPNVENPEDKIDIQAIPKSKNGGMYVRFMQSIDDYHPYNAETILRSELAIEKAEAEGTEYNPGKDLLDPEQFDAGHIFVGVYAAGLFDIVATPISSSYAGIGVHLSQMDTILQRNFIYDVPTWSTITIIVLMTIIGICLGETAGHTKVSTFVGRIAIFVFISALYIALAFAVFIKGAILPVSVPLAAIFLAFSVSIIKNYVTDGKKGRYVKAAFKQYLSPAVIDILIENPDALQLGGEEREITAYFSDVQGFTSISEQLSPTTLRDLLNTYLSAMTDIILASGGTIDKYEGDAIIAFWNAPLGQKDHAKRALEAALACQKKLADMQEELLGIQAREVGKDRAKPMFQRIGLNTGRAVVGNFGSRSRFDYTMLGDTVNLASRLEGTNKMFGTYTMCSKATMESATNNGCQLSFRKISKIAVVGKKEGVEIFEPMQAEEFNGRKGDFAVFAKGYEQFVNGKFDDAAKIFASTKDKDPAAAKYIAKCESLIKNPPEAWDGVWKATEK